MKRIVIGNYFWLQLKPKACLYIYGGVSETFYLDIAPFRTTYSNQIVVINKSYQVGPVKKKQPEITIEVTNDRPDGPLHEKEFKMEGNIYQLWKNGFTPKHSDYFVDVVFSWRLQPKPEN